MKEMSEILGSHRLLAGMSSAELDFLVGCARLVSFTPGQLLLREGDAADTHYLVRRGHVAVDVHEPGRGSMVIETVGSGGVVGWSWIIAPYRWTFDARAIDAVGAVAIDAACLRAKLVADPRFGVAVLTRVSSELLSRLQSTRLRLLDLYGAP